MTLLKNAIAASLLSSKPNGLADVGPGLGSIAEPTPGQDHPAFSNPKRACALGLGYLKRRNPG